MVPPSIAGFILPDYPGSLEFQLVAANRTSCLTAKSTCSLANLSTALLSWFLVMRSSFEFLQDPIAQDKLLEEPKGRFDPTAVYLDLERTMPSSLVEPQSYAYFLNPVIKSHYPSSSQHYVSLI
jgi:hypothetical protein